jgi:hypothetical protein
MKASTKWDDFKRMLNRALPKWVDLPLFDQTPKQNDNQEAHFNLKRNASD